MYIAYNTSVQATTGYTPFYLMYGRQIRMPVDLMYGTPSPQATTTTEYASRMKKDLEVAYQNVRENMGQRLDRQKELYDLCIHGTPFEMGDKVWLLCVAVPRGCPKKFHNQWKGPFQVIKRISDVTYQIQNLRRRSQKNGSSFQSSKEVSTKHADNLLLYQWHHQPTFKPSTSNRN